MCAYIKSFNKLSTDQQREDLDLFLENWEVNRKNGDIIVNNLRKDRFLPEGRMDVLLDFFLKNEIEDIEDMESELRNCFYDKLTCKGDEIEGEKPKYIGTVLTEERLRNHLLTYSGDLFGLAEAEKEVDEFIRFLEEHQYVADDRKDILIKEDYKLTWVTWDQDLGQEPFGFTEDRKIAVEVLSALGLGDEDMKDKKLFAFVFDYEKAMSTVTLQKPNFCDADLNVYFRPPETETKFGITEPLTRTIVDGLTSKVISIDGKPEAVCFNRNLKLDFFSKLKTYEP